MADQNRGRTSLPVPTLPRVGASPPAAEYGNQTQDGQGQADGERPRSSGVLVLRNWRVRYRLLALVIVPTVAAIVLGGFRVGTARTTAASFSRISQVATLGREFTTLTQSVEDERDLTAGYLASQQAGDKAPAATLLGKLQTQYGVTDKALAAAQGLAGQVSSASSGNPQTTRSDVTSAMQNLQVYLPDLREFIHTEIDPLAMTNAYTQLLSPLLTVDNDIAAGSSNPQLALFATMLGSAAQMEDQASQQRALLYAALFQNQFQPGLLEALTAAQTDQASSLAAFQSSGANVPAFVPASGSTPAGFASTLSQVQQFSNLVQGPTVDDAQRIELDALIAGQVGQQPNGGGVSNATDVSNAAEWFSDMTSTLNDMRSFDATELDAISSQAGTLEQGALGSERLTALLVLLLLLVVLFITIVVARSMILPLRRLRTDALDVANRRLPEMVRRLSESDEETAQSVQTAPIGIDSTDEIGEVARAFDRVHSEAVRLAGEEALLRLNLNAMFVNLSRRSQSLIERQLSIIDSLEQSEQDSDQLSNLFRLDHLATRMRRNSENLLVLAGHEAPRKWSQPVPLVDVLRAAISEIEQYERITLNVQPGIVVAGRVASDVVHLGAELLENATAFSPEHTQVLVAGQMLSSGGVLIDIADQGLGILDQELEYANWRLDNPPVIDVAVSRRMGLFVVGRLAARHEIRVRLRHAPSGGLSALIWLPEPVAEVERAPSLDHLRRPFDADAADPAWAPFQKSSLKPRTRPLATRAREAGNGGWFPPRSAGPPPVVPPVPVVPAATTVSPAPTVSPNAAGPQAAMGVPRTEPELPDTGAADDGLPIYDSVESDWFRRSGRSFSMSSQPPQSWTSPGDEGFRAARAVASPTADETTRAGLPKRVPKANLVPGSIDDGRSGHAENSEPVASAPPRSADDMRNRMANFQRGAREGRAAASWDFGTDEN